MAEGINLLPSQAKFQAKRMILKNKISSFMWIFGGGWVLLLLIVLGGFLISQLVVSQINKKYQTGLDQYKTMLSNMIINQQVKYQAKVVGQVLSERFEYGSSIEKVKSLFSSDLIKVEDVQIEDKKKFIVKGMIINGQQVNEIEQIVTSINNGEIEGFLKSSLKDIRVESGVWFFKMGVEIE
ncbi:hypothetical protein SDC9_110357 [bioreactor metagenome]|uniref:Uncharacterized protein n=1 Tax=bioreactor metagenome TaxID=1076179 RepID=A0A645BDR2_9ZZZZ